MTLQWFNYQQWRRFVHGMLIINPISPEHLKSMTFPEHPKSTSKLKWIVQKNLFNERGYDDFVGTIERMGFEHISVKVVPFSGELIPEITETEGVVAYGSTSLIRQAQQRKWNPGVFFNKNFTYTACNYFWGLHMLNYTSKAVPFSQIKIPLGEERFIRPNDDLKAFNGAVISGENFAEWQEEVLNAGSTTLGPDTLCVVAPLQDIAVEYRFFVVDQKIATSSIYKLGNTVIAKLVAARVLANRSVTDDDVFTYTQKRIAEWRPADAFVIDVARLHDGSFRIIEINCINSAGFYACDTSKIIQAISDYYEKVKLDVALN